jgi:hypothetical protein
MTLIRRAAGILVLAAIVVTLPSAAAAQRRDSFTWSIGLNAGPMIFETQTQDSEVVPSFGAHFLIMSRRGGLMVGIDEAFGSDEESGLVRFNDIRRWQAVMMAFPISAPIEPYFGIGGGIMQVVNPRIDNSVTDPFESAQLLELASEASTSSFATVLAGLQGQWGRMTAFAQYQLHTAPGDGKLLRGAMHSIQGGVRITLGSSREGVSAGGY